MNFCAIAPRAENDSPPTVRSIPRTCLACREGNTHVRVSPP
jgi:hypothetical protein